MLDKCSRLAIACLVDSSNLVAPKLCVQLRPSDSPKCDQQRLWPSPARFKDWSYVSQCHYLSSDIWVTLVAESKMSGEAILCQSDKCLNNHPSSRLECPTCHKLRLSDSSSSHLLTVSRLGIKGSFFCTQECFKSSCKLIDGSEISCLSSDYQGFVSNLGEIAIWKPRWPLEITQARSRSP